MKKLPVGDDATSSSRVKSKVKSWVDPAFSDVAAESFSLPGRSKVSRLNAESKRVRKRKGEVSRPEPLREAAPGDQDEPWVNRYAPCSQTELAVHKKKIEEVETWMRDHINSSKGAILLLTGPSGCGKTASLEVLARELGFRILEWINPITLHPYSLSEHEWKTNSFSCSSQLTEFREFLLKANKYSCLQMMGDHGTTERKLILVEDIPNQFYRQPGSLHDNLRHFVKSSRCPLVFVVSDSLSRDCSSRFLFPREIQEELHISCISFNPVAPTMMIKVLTRISTLEAGKSCGRMSVPEKDVLERLCTGSSGDIRSAINSLQFSSLPDPSLDVEQWRMRRDRPATSVGKAVSRTKPSRKKSKQTKDQVEEQAIGGKDASLFLFRALGKILHCKRGDADVSESSSAPGHSPHTSQHRKALLIDPELVVERSHMSGEFFNLYLHQNYLDFFSEVDDVAIASQYLSDADVLTSDWTNRIAMEEYGSSVATRGLLHSNSQQVSVGFRPLHKPSWLLVNKKYRENRLAAQALFRNFGLNPGSLLEELLPYLAKLTNPMRDQAQIGFIQDVGRMSFRNISIRLKPEALKDKEPGQLPTNQELEFEQQEKAAEQETSEDGLFPSQPQLPTSEVLVEEEDDMVIEEYDSD